MSLRSRLSALSLSLALAAPLFLGLGACAGKIDDGAFQTCPATENCADTGPLGDDTGGDTLSDTSLDTYPQPDTAWDGPGGCGVGPCTPGTSCAISSCTTAYCTMDGSWVFTGACPPDGGICPATQPYDGQSCSTEGQSCPYFDMGCGVQIYATCNGGRWSVPIVDCPPPPPTCPPSEPTAGTYCPSVGAKCTWTSACGALDTGVCDPSTHQWTLYPSACPGGCPSLEPANGSFCGGTPLKCTWTSACGATDGGYCDPATARWNIFPGTCSGGCPVSEPASGSPCTGTSSCKWPNSCGGTDYGTCSAGRWNLSIGPCTTPGCPVAVPRLGDACPVVGQACYWPCDKAYCSPTGWVPTNGTCGGCPTSEPSPGASCASPGTSCSWPNTCGGKDTGYCDGTYRWQLTGGSCPVPTCPATTPTYGSACYSGLSCNYGNGCGGIDYWYCSGGAWIGKGPSPCYPGCPATKPTTGSACMLGTTSCSYITDTTNQCTSNCFCSDVGTWACTTPTCSGPVPPPYADAGPIYYDAGVGVMDAYPGG